MANLFDEFIGKRLERVHYLPEGLGDYKTVTLNFSNGRCITFEVELQTRPDAIYPAMRGTIGRWEMIKAEPSTLSAEEAEELEKEEAELDSGKVEDEKIA